MSPEASTSRYFTLKDDKSNKFWQIAVAENSYTVSYGRIGTAGQSLHKTYDTAYQCRIAAEKIIQEKIAKGYSEEGGTTAALATAIPKSRNGGAIDVKEAEEATLRAYQELINKGGTNDLLPFLQSVNRVHYPALRKAIKAARKHYCELSFEVVEGKGGQSWRGVYKGTEVQRCIIELSAVAILPVADLKSFNPMLYLNDLKLEALVDGILHWSKPSWLTEFLNDDSRKYAWSMPEYGRLRRWEEKGFVNYLPELFARSISQCHARPYDYDHEANGKCYINYLCNDAIAYTRDLPLLFEYETDLHTASYGVQPDKERPITIVYIWDSLFRRLLQENKLDRKWLLEACINVQTKDWNANLRSFFRKQVDEMAVSTEDLIDIQPSLFQLLGAQHPHVVNWVVGWIKNIATSPDFDNAMLLEWAPSVMMRSDCKTAIKALLSVLEKGMKKDAPDNSDILVIVTDVFTQTDLALQTKVAALIKKYGSTNDETLREKLQLYKEQMLGTIRQELQDFIAAPEASTVPFASTEKTTYHYTPALAPLLRDLEEVVLPQTWNDWLFAVGKYLGSDDMLDMEILVNACITPPPDTPTDGEQLLPYVKQLEVADGSRIRTFTNNWLLQVLQDPKQLFHQQQLKGDYDTIRLHIKRLHHAQRKMHAESKLPLLSLPSHKPYYIAPTVLVDRLIRYQEAGEEIDNLDLTIAITRTLSDGAVEALNATEQLYEPLKSLIRFALSGEGDPAPKKEGGLLKTIAKGLGLRKETDNVNFEMAYITAARTRKPDGVFGSLAKSQFANRPNVVSPLVPAWRLKENWNEYVDWRTKEKTRTPSWRELFLDLSDKKYAESPLLYSNDLVAPNKEIYWWFGLIGSDYDIGWWYSIIPQAPESLFTLLLMAGCRLSELTVAATSGLRLMLDKHFRFREMSTTLLACGLIASKREDRGLAAEVLIQHMSTQTIDPITVGQQLGALLRESYAPVQRFAESLQLIKDVSPEHNKALLMLLEEVIHAFGLISEAPKNTKKLIEIYIDLLVKTGERPEASVLSLLERWSSGTLKPLILSLQKLGTATTTE